MKRHRGPATTLRGDVYGVPVLEPSVRILLLASPIIHASAIAFRFHHQMSLNARLRVLLTNNRIFLLQLNRSCCSFLRPLGASRRLASQYEGPVTSCLKAWQRPISHTMPTSIDIGMGRSEPEPTSFNSTTSSYSS